MLLDERNAVIYGGAGGIGGAVARAFAAEGASVHLAGRTAATLEAVADDIRSRGGRAGTAVVDALDEAALDAHLDGIAAAGGIDVVLNVIGHPYTHGVPVHEMALDDYVAPIDVAVRSSFLVWRAAARHMVARGSGVILAFGGTGPATAGLGGTQVAFGTVEVMRGQFAVELAPHGVRVVSLQTGGIPETISDPEVRAQIEDLTARQSPLGRAADLEDVGRIAAFLASAHARAITGTEINMTSGSVID
jgi:NAD(P)-dependent dehydrogenase (short-subunit alcohol dehydrogenase family)